MSCPARQGSPFEVTSDLGSGMNYSKQDLKRLLADLIAGKVDRLVITHKDRLLRFGTELVFAICEAKRAEVVTDFRPGSTEASRGRTAGSSQA